MKAVLARVVAPAEQVVLAGQAQVLQVRVRPAQAVLLQPVLAVFPSPLLSLRQSLLRLA